ncbi:hypothetical protein [Chamaesiphon sp.]|uniref:hypothetical protein n=1 Tax=Chamaesiphon sp. TaxID=2814140 RepID=UPI00359362F3
MGNKESARRALEGIEQLSPERREKNDTIRASLKYCVYLQDFPTTSLSAEEQEFMRTMAEIDAWYDAEIDKAEQRGKLEFATRAIGVKFQGYVPTEHVTSQLAALNEQQLDDLIVGMFSWQTVAQMEEWLNSVDS